jgi:hypothetical protein
MLLQVLGPVTATSDNSARVQFRPRALLAVLLHIGQPRQADMLADSLWGEKRPLHAEKTVQVGA